MLHQLYIALMQTQGKTTVTQEKDKSIIGKKKKKTTYTKKNKRKKEKHLWILENQKQRNQKRTFKLKQIATQLEGKKIEKKKGKDT